MPTTNSLGTLAATGVLHDALAITLKRLPFITGLASNIAPEMGQKMMPFNVSQTLKDYNATQTVYDRSVTGTYDKQIGETLPSDKTFTLNKWPYISFSFSAVEVNQLVETYTNKDARQVAIRKLLQRCFNALATQIVNDFLAVVTAANYPNNYVSAVSTMDFKKLGGAVDVFLQNDSLIQTEPPFALLEIVCFREFANSLTAIANPTFSIEEVMRLGTISEGVSGARNVSRYNLTQPSDAPRGFLLDPMAMVFANRVPYEERLANDPVYLEIITDAATGFSVLYREAKNPSTGEVTRTITTLYGFAIGLVNHLVRITTS
jgi:hypothetical protein